MRHLKPENAGACARTDGDEGLREGLVDNRFFTPSQYRHGGLVAKASAS